MNNIMDMLILKYYVFLIEETIWRSLQEFYQNLSHFGQFNSRSTLLDLACWLGMAVAN